MSLSLFRVMSCSQFIVGAVVGAKNEALSPSRTMDRGFSSSSPFVL
jgi:hypothetical protein